MILGARSVMKDVLLPIGATSVGVTTLWSVALRISACVLSSHIYSDCVVCLSVSVRRLVGFVYPRCKPNTVYTWVNTPYDSFRLLVH